MPDDLRRIAIAMVLAAMVPAAWGGLPDAVVIACLGAVVLGALIALIPLPTPGLHYLGVCMASVAVVVCSVSTGSSAGLCVAIAPLAVAVCGYTLRGIVAAAVVATGAASIAAGGVWPTTPASAGALDFVFGIVVVGWLSWLVATFVRSIMIRRRAIAQRPDRARPAARPPVGRGRDLAEVVLLIGLAASLIWAFELRLWGWAAYVLLLCVIHGRMNSVFTAAQGRLEASRTSVQLATAFGGGGA